MAVEFMREGPVGYITLDRPPANSYDHAFMEELGEAVEAASSEENARAIIVRSASDRFFSAGADVKAFAANSTEKNMEMINLAHRVLLGIAAIPKIFVAQIGGHALGGGLEIALACDLRFGSDGDYRLGVPEATLGLIPGNGGTQRLPRLIGPSRSLDLMVTGRQLSPAEAVRLGLLDRVFPADRLAGETAGYATALANGASKAIGSIKFAVHEGLQTSLQDGLALERRIIEDVFRSADAEEGITAFSEKRKPKFVGR
jgi:enoyl-CoA hydratase/carnithine racemase